MTTREPGASEVLTQGLTVRPRSTAFLASRPAAIITAGLDVLVQLVMAATTTWPWSSSHVAPSARVTDTGLETLGTIGSSPSGTSGAVARAIGPCAAGGSLAGNDSAP